MFQFCKLYQSEKFHFEHHLIWTFIWLKTIYNIESTPWCLNVLSEFKLFCRFLDSYFELTTTTKRTVFSQHHLLESSVLWYIRSSCLSKKIKEGQDVLWNNWLSHSWKLPSLIKFRSPNCCGNNFLLIMIHHFVNPNR